MALIGKGNRFRDFTLPDLSGRVFDTKTARVQGPLIAAFFKVNCPVCQMTFPYLQRLADMHPNAQVVGVSQNDPAATGDYAKTYGCTFPMLLDASLSVTDSFDLQTVPAVYLTDDSGEVLEYTGGWDKEWVIALGRRFGETPVVPSDDKVMAYRPG